MKALRTIRSLFLPLLLAFAAAGVCWAKGTAEEKAAEPVIYNPEWKLVVTAFDVSALPEARQVIADLTMRRLTAALGTLGNRERQAGEAAYYESLAWSKIRFAAASALDKEHSNRDAIVFRGDTAAKKQEATKASDEKIAALREALEKAESEPPLVAPSPKFVLGEDRPAPPKPGGEFAFCSQQKADAFLIGAFQEYHGRMLLEIRVWALYAGAWVYQDEAIFSLEDEGSAASEISGRLCAFLAGVAPVRILVRAEAPQYQAQEADDSGEAAPVAGEEVFAPETAEAAEAETTEAAAVGKAAAEGAAAPGEAAPAAGEGADGEAAVAGDTPDEADEAVLPNAVILINDVFAGRGEASAEVYPGPLKIQVFAPGYLQAERSFENFPSVNEFSARLNPLLYDALGVEAPDGEEASVYLGALYVGQTPLVGETAVRVPYGEYSYVLVEGQDARQGSAVVNGGGAVTFDLRDTEIPEEKSVDYLRKKFYQAYGRFWIALPLALLANGYTTAIQKSFTDWRAIAAMWISYAVWAIPVGFGVDAIVRFVFYIGSADSPDR
jgi:hypothetical protein